MRYKVKIPIERIGVLIGQSGIVKKKIESSCKVKLSIDSETGGVDIITGGNLEDPSVILKVQNIVSAIGRGFSPHKAFDLLKDDVMLDIIELKDAVGKSRRNLQRVKGRLIGRQGKTRKIIEETADANISIYGHTVSFIGRQTELDIAREALKRLIEGSQHKTVYDYLGRRRHELKKERLNIWEEKGG